MNKKEQCVVVPKHADMLIIGRATKILVVPKAVSYFCADL